MATLNGLPVYKMKPGMGVDFHSLVSDPAIEVNYKTFSNKERYKFNQEKQIITGPFMIPDLPIYRNDPQHGEYYVVFEKATIQQLNEMFMKEQKTLSFNYQHQEGSKVEGAVLVENWIVGDNDNKAKELGFDVPVGTWMGSVKINNKQFWDEEIKSGKVKGFSIEGYLDMDVTSSRMADYPWDQCIEDQMKRYGDKTIAEKVCGAIKNGTIGMKEHVKIVSDLIDENIKLRKQNMSNQKFAVSAKATDGTVINTTADTLEEGAPVTTVDADGKEIPLPDGDYTLENGDVLTVAGGKVTAYTEPDESMMTEEEIAAMSKVFSKVIEAATKPLIEKIEALEAKFKNTPGAPAATGATDKKEVAKTPTQTAMAKLKSLKESIKK